MRLRKRNLKNITVNFPLTRQSFSVVKIASWDNEPRFSLKTDAPHVLGKRTDCIQSDVSVTAEFYDTSFHNSHPRSLFDAVSHVHFSSDVPPNIFWLLSVMKDSHVEAHFPLVCANTDPYIMGYVDVKNMYGYLEIMLKNNNFGCFTETRARFKISQRSQNSVSVQPEYRE